MQNAKRKKLFHDLKKKKSMWVNHNCSFSLKWKVQEKQFISKLRQQGKIYTKPLGTLKILSYFLSQAGFQVT